MKRFRDAGHTMKTDQRSLLKPATPIKTGQYSASRYWSQVARGRQQAVRPPTEAASPVHGLSGLHHRDIALVDDTAASAAGTGDMIQFLFVQFPE